MGWLACFGSQTTTTEETTATRLAALWRCWGEGVVVQRLAGRLYHTVAGRPIQAYCFGTDNSRVPIRCWLSQGAKSGSQVEPPI